MDHHGELLLKTTQINIANNIQTYLQDLTIKSALDPETNKTTKELMQTHTELEAYAESLLIMYATMYSVLTVPKN
jgi:hypothetical protein